MSSSSSSSSKVSKVCSVDFPLLVSFPLGVPQDDCVVSATKKESSKVCKRIVTTKGTSSSFQYKGSDFGDASTKKNCTGFAVGIRNKTTGKIEVVRADHVFVMRPEDKTIDIDARKSLTNMERRVSLTEEFGSSKKKRALKAAQGNLISSENIYGATAIEDKLSKKSTKVSNELLESAERALLKSRGKK